MTCTMIGKKCFVMMLLIISCLMQTVAQTGYYYKGKRIPLSVNDSKVCISIPKDSEITRERILANVKALDNIADEYFDILIISQSEFNKLTTLDSWKEDAKSIIITSGYSATDETEVFVTPYLNIRLKREQDTDLLTSYAEKYRLKIVKQDPFMPLWYILAITLDSDINALECANKIWESGKFAESVPDLSSNDLICSNDPMFNQQWGLYNSNYSGIDISISSAWTARRTTCRTTRWTAAVCWWMKPLEEG